METENQITKALKELNGFIDTLIKAEANNYTKEYRESEWYKEPTLEDVDENIARDIKAFKNALENGTFDASYLAQFEEKAKEQGRSWYDEDLHRMRTGYEWESGVYTTLRNIAATCTGDDAVDTKVFYEGVGV